MSEQTAKAATTKSPTTIPKRFYVRSAAVAMLAVWGVYFLCTGPLVSATPRSKTSSRQQSAKETSVNPFEDPKLSTATFGGGCFWCTEAVFRELHGVEAVVSGYSGGKVENPTYQEVSSGLTGHAEVIHIAYDPKEVDFETLLEVFWRTHDPTTLNQQGPDVGTQYRSAVFYHDAEQQEVAEEVKKKLDASGAFDKPIVTEISKFEKFYPAEKYHQDFYKLNPRQGYCRAVITPKMHKFRKVFKDKLKSKKEKADFEKGGDSVSDNSNETADAVDKQKVDWKNVDWSKKLTKEQFYVTQKEGTERAFKNEYWDNKRAGVYHCVCCGLPVYDSETKFKSGTGWPSFYQPIDPKNVGERLDRSFFSTRTEVHCARCEAHLGHVFNDGPKPTGLRYCMNSAALKFEPKKSEEK